MVSPPPKIEHLYKSKTGVERLSIQQVPRKMPRKAVKTTTYGAPTVDNGFSVIKMTDMRFDDDSKSFEFEFQLEIDGDLQCFWLTWEEANTFPQYQTCFWFYIRDTITTWHANDVEDFLPSTTIDDLMEEEETGVPALRRAGSVCGKGHTRFTDSSSSSEEEVPDSEED